MNGMNPSFTALLVLLLGVGTASAGSATWLAMPTSGDWNTAANWTLGGPPNGPLDNAAFHFSTVTAVSISTNTEIDAIAFQPGASGFTITAGSTFQLIISGSGIANDSGITQNFVADTDLDGFGTIRFTNSATAGEQTFFVTSGALNGENRGVTEFRDNSSAGRGHFTTNGGEVSGAFGGRTQFFNSSTAGDGSFTNNGPAVSGAGRGVTLFFDSSTGGNGVFTNNGGQVPSGLASFTFFFDNSNAGSGTYVNNGGGAPFAEGGSTQFFDSSSAADSRFLINGGAVSGGLGATMGFFDSSTAGNGTFETNGGAVEGEGGGSVEFHHNSNAGNGAFITNGITANFAQPGYTRFFDTSTAGSGTFITNGGGTNGAAGGGVTEFLDSSSAGNATFTVNGVPVSDGSGGSVDFRNSSNAGNGTFTINGGTFEGAGGGQIIFSETASAGNATLIANAGTGGGDGGLILFGIESTGGTALLKVFGNARLDISGLFGTFYDPQHDPGLTIGSLEGSGMAFLGANRLTVGSNNLSTIFSGVVQDGGIQGTRGGSLAKIGTGTLTLSGANTYTGGTIISGGALAAGHAMAFGGGSVTLTEGTLRLDGANHTVSVATDYVQNGGTLQLRIGGGAAGVDSDLLLVGVNTGTANLNSGSTLSLIRQDGFALTSLDRIALLRTKDGLFGRFSTVLGLGDVGPTGTILFPVVTYDAFNVYLELSQGNFSDLTGLTPNQQAVATNLDDAAGDPAFVALNDFLVNQQITALPAIFDRIAPEELTAIYQLGFSQMNVQTLNLQRRLSDIRSGVTGFSSAGYGISGDGAEEAQGKNARDARSGPPLMNARPDNRWGVFVTGTGQFVEVGGDFNAPGYEITSGGITFGIDYRVSRNLALGLYGGYARGEADLVHEGKIDADGGKIGGYATFHHGAFYLDGIAGTGFNRYHTSRAALLGRARGETDGGEFHGQLATGFDWKLAGFDLGPRASISYSKVSFDGFTETGFFAPLRLSGHDQDSLHSALELTLSRDYKLGRAILRPEIGAAWKHEFGDDLSYDINARLASGAGEVFSAAGPKLGRKSALLKAGFSVEWSARCATYFFYNTEIGRHNYDSHAVSGGVRISF